MGVMHVATVEEVARAVGSAADAAWLRSVLPFRGAWRVGVMELAAPHRLRFDGFVATADLDAARTAVAPGALGGWNPGFSHGFRVAWWGGKGAWRCVDAHGASLATVTETAVRVGERELSLSDVDCVELFVAPAWERRAVRVVPFDEAPIELVTDEDATPAVDPAYDLESLEMDVAWMGALATALAAAVGRPSFRRISPR